MGRIVSLGVYSGDREDGSAVGVERRLEFVEFRLFWERHVNRRDLMDAVEISVNQASTDLNRYVGMRAGKAKSPMLKAFLYYALKRLGLDAETTVQRPQDQQIVFLNRAQVEDASRIKEWLG